jgi:DNA (cytosine-5)-methyltransferase 1
MENVKGILSSSLNGKGVFGQILDDLMDPDLALGKGRSKKGYGYRPYSMVTGECLSRDQKEMRFHPRDFVLCAEDYGVPQRRHRVFILGVRDNIPCEQPPILKNRDQTPLSLDAVIGNLPPLRSGLSSRNSTAADSFVNWRKTVSSQKQRIRTLSSQRSDKYHSGEEIVLAAAVAEQAIAKLSQRNSPLPKSAARLTYEVEILGKPVLPRYLK